MKKKNITALGFAILPAMFVLSACGDGGSATGEFASDAKKTETSQTLQEVKNKGALEVGVKYDAAPFGFIPEGQSNPAGFDIDIASEFAKRLEVDANFVQVTTKNRIPNLETGKVDMVVASMLKTPEREEAIDFSKVYFSDEQKLLVMDDSDVNDVTDLAGKTVAVAQGGPEGANVLELEPKAKVRSFQSWPQALQSMRQGDADAVSTTVGILSGLNESAKKAGVKVRITGDSIHEGPVGAGFRKGDDELREAFNEALVEMVKDGTYDKISDRWWSDVRDEPYAVDTETPDK